MARADGEGAADEFSDRGAERNVAVKNVECGFSLIDSATTNTGEQADYEDAHKKSGDRRNCEEPPAMILRKRTEKCKTSPVDGEAETDHGQPGKNSDKNGKQEEERFFVEYVLKEGGPAARAQEPAAARR